MDNNNYYYLLKKIVKDAYIPSVKEEAAECSEEKAGLQARVNKINGFEVLLHVRRNRVVDPPETGDSGKILAPLDAGVHVQHHEFPLPQLRENLILQVLLQNINTHQPRCRTANNTYTTPSVWCT